MRFKLSTLRLSKILAPVVDAVFPARCAGCGHRGEWVCDECQPKITLLVQPWCRRCGVPTDSGCRCHELSSSIAAARSVAVYNGWMQSAIRLMKYENEPARIPSLGNMMTPLARGLPYFDAFVLMPMHRSRHRRRGYNQAELLANELSRQIDRPVSQCLVRTRATQQQVGLSGDQRRENVAGAFGPAPGAKIAGQRFVLIDDVMTTGSSLNTCADVLQAAGAVWVGTLTLAREI